MIDDQVLVANTGKNCLSLFDGSGNHLREIFLNEVRYQTKYGDRSGNHFNSVHSSGDRVYVTAHNYEKPSEIWELSWPELAVIRVHPTKTNWAHNVWMDRSSMVICNSKYGSLYEVGSQETIWDSGEVGAFSRGLAVSSDYLFVGCSTYSLRKDRYWTSGAIWVIDRKTLQTLDKIHLPGSGQVNDLRLVDTIDECHNGQVITMEMLRGVRKHSAITDLAYTFRRKIPTLQRDIPLLSQIVRASQIRSDRMRREAA
jgi:hypothetical protein